LRFLGIAKFAEQHGRGNGSGHKTLREVQAAIPISEKANVNADRFNVGAMPFSFTDFRDGILAF
jgi:hypothetical protein